MAERIYASLANCRQDFVEREERKIKFGGDVNSWRDVEADEVDLRKSLASEGDHPKGKPTTWEQWGGIVQRGDCKKLVLFRLPQKHTRKRAPGPGPIKKRDLTKIGKKHLAKRSVILHTDGARAYQTKLDGVVHDNVVHKKKLVLIRGKKVWVKPKYTKIVKHVLNDTTVWCKAGTQIIDSIWAFIKRHLKGNTDAVGSKSLRRKVRSAQWCYWHRGEDLWMKTGDMLRTLT